MGAQGEQAILAERQVAEDGTYACGLHGDDHVASRALQEELEADALGGGVVQIGGGEVAPGGRRVWGGAHAAVDRAAAVAAALHHRRADHLGAAGDSAGEHRGELGAKGAQEQVVATGDVSFVAQLAELAHWGVVVVAGSHEHAIAAHGAPAPVAKVRTAGPHPVREARGAHGDKLVQRDVEALGGLVGLAGGAPAIEPAAPELAHDHGVLGPERAGLEQLLGHAAPAVAELGPARRSPHAGVLGHVDAARNRGLGERLLVLVVAVAPGGPVLVLDLAEDHRAAVGGLARRDDRQQRVEPAQRGLQVGRVVDAQLKARLSGEPGGHAAILPLGADVRAGAHDHIEPALAAEVDKGAEVGLCAEVERARARLVAVPGDHKVDCVQARPGGQVELMLPLGARVAEVV